MAVGSIATRGRVVRRRWTDTAIGSWIATTDHKKLGIMYIYTGVIFFLVGGAEASLIRLQLLQPNNTVLSPEAYDQVFTMHGTTMIFLFVMPTMAGFGNYLVPLMIGARDMAFPRLNALGYWLLFFAGIFLTSSFIFGAAPNAGWFSYAPLTEATPNCLAAQIAAQTFQQQAALAAQGAASGVQGCFSPGANMDFWIIGINLLGISSIVGSLNFIVTILRLRAPGMSINRMPLFVWMTMITAFLSRFCAAEPHCRQHAAAFRPPSRHALLSSLRGWRSTVMATPLLVFRPPGGVRPHLARLRHGLGDLTSLLREAHLRLHLRGLVGRRHWLLELHRLGAPYVRRRAADGGASVLRFHHHPHRHTDGGEDLQLGGDDLRR